MRFNMPYIETDFPIEKLNPIVHREVNARTPIYHLHKWWARRAGSTFRAMILASFLNEDPWNYFYQKVELKKNGKAPIILDPFMGGGTTVIESLRLGAKVIGVDINPVAWFIVKKEIEQVDLKKVEKEFKKLEEKVGEKIKLYYKTKCLQGHDADVMYTFWVKKIKCENCGRNVQLFNSFVIAKPEKKMATVFCPMCGLIQKLDSVNKVACKECGSKFLLSEGYVKGQQYECPVCRYTGEVLNVHICKECGFEFVPSEGYVKKQKYKCSQCGYTGEVLSAVQKENKTLDLEMFALEYYCSECGRGYKKVDSEDIALFKKAKIEFEEKREHLLYPRKEIPYGQTTKSLLNYNYKYFYQLFNERQLLLLSMLLDEILKIEDEKIKEFFITVFSDILNYNNMSNRYQPDSQKLAPLFQRQVYWLPLVPTENNVWGVKYGAGTFIKFFKKGKKALEYLHNPYEIMIKERTKKNGKKVLDRVNFEIQGDKIDGKITNEINELNNGTKNALLLCRTSETLSDFPDKSIDAVITDPPYFDNVMYSELSDFFYVWLRLGLKDKYPDIFSTALTNKDREIVKNDAQGKDENFFTEALKNVFKESNRVLKDEGIMAFTFHHKNTAAWGAVLKALLDSNFKIIQTYPIYSETKGGLRDFNINYDSIIVCKKRIQKEVQKIPYAIFEVQLRDRINKGVDRIIEMHPDLEFEDAYTIAMGNALHLYSENYGGIIHNGKTLEINEALETLGDIVFDILLRKILVKVPDVDRLSKIYSAVFATKTKVTTDTVNKITRHGGIDTNAFENEVLIKKTRGDMKVQSAKERKKHLKKKIENGLPLLYIDAAHYLKALRSEGTNFSQGVMEVLKSIDKNKLESYIQFIGERTKDTEWKRLLYSLESIKQRTLKA